MASNSLGDFDNRMKRKGEQLERGIGLMVRTAALAADTELVLATPVDTGRARSNWVASVNEAVTETRAPYAEGIGGSTGASNAQSAIDQAKAVIEERKTEQTLYISNNLSYIARLNEGSSAQAPAGFVQTAVKRAVQIARQQVNKIFNQNGRVS